MESTLLTLLSQFAAAVAEHVPDAKAARANVDIVLDALERYSEDYPLWEQRDIGDGSTREWDLSASPFAYTAAAGSTGAKGFLFGYSDLWPIQIEDLASAAVSQNPRSWRQFGEGRDAWLERRTVSNEPKTYLVFASAPATNLVRVHFRRRWTIHASVTTNVPPHHRGAVVDLACALKCEVLASTYRKAVDSVGGSDVFSAVETADAYLKQAGGFWSAYRRALGIASSAVPVMATGICRTGRVRVFPRGAA